VRTPGVLDPAEEWNLIARFALGLTKEDVARDPERALSNAAVEKCSGILDARRCGEPLAYAVGKAFFCGREFVVDKRVLIPRPETESLVEAARAFLAARQGARVLDIGTGSGCIAITLALDFPDARVTATDVSVDALDVARENARRLKATRNLRFLPCDVYGCLDARERFDLIVSNPPYVSNIDDLDDSVRRHEPMSALLAGERGTAFHRRIMAGHERLASEGSMILEMAPEQKKIIERLAQATGAFAKPAFLRDLNGEFRVAVLTRQG
jgi:release factor glutamine methyltransferase